MAGLVLGVGIDLRLRTASTWSLTRCGPRDIPGQRPTHPGLSRHRIRNRQRSTQTKNMVELISPNSDVVQSLVQFLVSEYDVEELQEVRQQYIKDGWPEEYVNRETGKVYKPHHGRERLIVYSDTPRHVLVRAGEGAGKSVLGLVKTLDRLKRGCNGLMVSPDFEHFKKLWPEFQRWCPWDRVHERHQYRKDISRIPNQPFQLALDNDIGTVSTLMCGGIQENNVMAWEGPNVNFAWMDEMRRHKTPEAMNTLLGRIRIPGPGSEPPQLWITTTPMKHWLYEYFGEMKCTCSSCDKDYEWNLAPNTIPVCPNCSSTEYITSDQWESFKRQAAVIKMSLRDNEENLYTGFANDRALPLSEAEARVRIEGEWEDLDDTEHFLPSMTLWDTCREDIPPLDANEPIVLGVDAATGRTNAMSDCFAIVGVSRHWDRAKRRDHIVVRFVHTWQARAGKQIIFRYNDKNDPNYHGPEGPEDTIRRLVNQYRIIQVAYDPTQLHDLGTRLYREHVVWTDKFGQQSSRAESDSDLLQLILSRRIIHDGNSVLREHIENADRKVTDDGNRLRIVKRLDHLKIDAAVALSMAAYRCLHLNIW